MSMNTASIRRQLEELQLIQCSLLPTERLTFLDDALSWEDALQKYSDDEFMGPSSLTSWPSIEIHVDDAKIWFQLNTSEEPSMTTISAKGEGISRAEQERWRSVVSEKMQEISDSEFPIYQLVSLHLLPLLHEEIQNVHPQTSVQQATAGADNSRNSEPFHVLFTSHHLISPNKTRSLQKWSSSLSLSGFAKVGYPGVIYAQGERINVEEFVDNVKAMQWLALKVRFVESLPVVGVDTPSLTGWKEFQKVGEVVEEMRRIGRQEYVVEMGIGSASVNNSA